MSERHIRQFDLLKRNPRRIDIIGAGATGSWTALCLAKMGYDDITVHDLEGECVEDHNVATQFFTEAQLGVEKVDALAENIKAFSGVGIKTVKRTLESKFSGVDTEILILACDSMEGRKKISESSNYELLLDPRMGGLVFTILSNFPFTKHDYEKTLYTDAEAVQEPCTGRSICFNALGIASQLCNMVKKFDMGEKLPFKTDMDFVNIRLFRTNL